MNYIAILQAVAAMMPTLVMLIKQMEDLLPAPGAGAQKLDAVLNILQATMEASGQAMDTFNQIKPVVTKTVTAIVAIFNATGVFKKQ